MGDSNCAVDRKAEEEKVDKCIGGVFLYKLEYKRSILVYVWVCEWKQPSYITKSLLYSLSYINKF